MKASDLLKPTDKLIRDNGKAYLCSRCDGEISPYKKSRTIHSKGNQDEGIKDGEYIFHLNCCLMPGELEY